MKKQLTILASLLPTLTFAQSAAGGDIPGIFSFIIAIAIAIGIFIALRAVMLWYWKVDIIIQNQEKLIKTQQETNELLERQLIFIKDRNELRATGSSSTEKSVYKDSEGRSYYIEGSDKIYI